MLEIAKDKAKHYPNIQYVQGDALKLPYDDNTFDVAIISFGLRNLESLEHGLREMQRVVKPNGYVVNIDQGKPSDPIFRALYHVYFYNIAPIIGKLVFHMGEFNSFRYLPESNKYFPEQRKLVEIFKTVGFVNIQNYDYLMGAVAQQVAQVDIN
jgi:demethylmenaquinone methyltransferase/2-methoxy-6-polyprenyl-1,4-benzoquinol methylase